MRKFIYKTLLFTLPVLLLFLAIELFIVFKPNSFNTKAKYIQNNLDVEAVFLGSSHTQNGINPEFMSLKTVNLAYGGQDYTLDSTLFFHYASKLPNLKYVFLEMDYHSLEHTNLANYFRNPWYYKYHDISGLNLTSIEKYSLYLSNPTFFKNYLTLNFDPKEYKYEINQYGFVTNDFPGVFKDFNHDSIQIQATAASRLRKRHKQNSIENYQLNKRRLLSIIDYCLEHDIKVILFRNPVYPSYRNQYIHEKNERRLHLLDSLISTNKIEVMDFENSKDFKVTDFKNDDHLNSSGAKKLTLMTNEKLMNIIKQNQ